MDDQRGRLVLEFLPLSLIERLSVVVVQQRAVFVHRGAGGVLGTLSTAGHHCVFQPCLVGSADCDSGPQLQFQLRLRWQLDGQHLRQRVLDALVVGAQRLKYLPEFAPALVLVAHCEMPFGVHAWRDDDRYDYVAEGLALSAAHRSTDGLYHVNR